MGPDSRRTLMSLSDPEDPLKHLYDVDDGVYPGGYQFLVQQ